MLLTGTHCTYNLNNEDLETTVDYLYPIYELVASKMFNNIWILFK